MGMLKKGGVIKESSALPDPIPSSNLLTVQTIERYTNHLGATDNFTQTGTGGNGTATADATNHEMDLTSGLNLAGYGKFETKKQWTLSTTPLVATFILNNVVASVANRQVKIGFDPGFTNFTSTNGVIVSNIGGSWLLKCTSGGSGTQAAISAITDGSIITFVVTSLKAIVYVGGILQATITTNIPTVAMNLGAAAHNSDGGAANNATVSVDMIDFVRYSL